VKELSNYYQICVQGHLGQNWTDMFHAFQIQYKENGVTVLTGPIVDQAALRGLLDHLFDLGLSILSIRNLGLYPESKVTFPS